MAARSYLRFSDSDFWDLTPRVLVSLIDEYWHQEECRMYREGSWHTRWGALLVSSDADIPKGPKRANDPPIPRTFMVNGEEFVNLEIFN